MHNFGFRGTIFRYALECALSGAGVYVYMHRYSTTTMMPAFIDREVTWALYVWICIIFNISIVICLGPVMGDRPNRTSDEQTKRVFGNGAHLGTGTSPSPLPPHARSHKHRDQSDHQPSSHTHTHTL